MLEKSPPMSRIAEIVAREIFDSRGFPTVEVDVRTDCGALGRASVPSGASKGSHEAIELRDHDLSRFLGKGVTQATAHIREQIAPALIGVSVFSQRDIDAQMCSLDGTENKSKLGANAILGVSIAVARAAAVACGQPLYRYIGGLRACLLPVPMVNVLNGGRHADNALDFQEFMIMPVGAGTLSEALRISAEIFHHLRDVLKAEGLSTNVGDEGGFAAALSSNEAAVEVLLHAIRAAGYTAGKEILLCIDAASTEYYDSQEKVYKIGGQIYNSSEMVNFWADWHKRYPIFSIEDAMAEDDWQGWRELSLRIGQKVQLVGDDLFATNPKRLAQGVKENVGNAILIKLNQIGTLSETLDVIQQAERASYRAVISHRSGETEDTTIAHLAVATAVGQIKTGSMSRSDRLAKYNQLLRIEEQLLPSAQFAGAQLMQHFRHQQTTQ